MPFNIQNAVNLDFPNPGNNYVDSGANLWYDPTATYFFSPPLINSVPRYSADSTNQQKGLFKFYSPFASYVQVFVLSDGSCVQNFSTPENTKTAIPYPWNPDDPNGPFMWGTAIDYTKVPPQPYYFSSSHDIYIVKMYDRPQTITGNEANLLYQASAGYAGGAGFSASIE